MKSKKILQKLLTISACIALVITGILALATHTTSAVHADTTTYKEIYNYEVESVSSIKDTKGSDITKTLVITNGDDTLSNVTYTDSQTLKVEHTDATNTNITTSDTLLNTNQARNYRVTVRLTTSEQDGTVYLKLYDTTKSDLKKEITITSDVSSKDYSFFILGDPKDSHNLKLDIDFGRSGSEATGTLFLHFIKIDVINYTIYSNSSSSYQLSLFKDVTLDKYDYYVSNGCFNSFEIGDAENIYPAKPKDFTITRGSTDTQLVGVVNTNEFTSLPAIVVNPTPTANENMLLLYNAAADILTVTSGEFTLSANSYYQLGLKGSQYVSNGTLILTLVDTTDDTQLVELVGTTLTSNGEDMMLYLHTGDSTVDVKLKLTLQTTGEGYALVDNVVFKQGKDQDQLKTIYEDYVYDNPTSGAKADLNEPFYSVTINGVSTVPFFVSNDEDVKVETVAVTDHDSITEALKISTDAYSNFQVRSRWSKSLTTNSYYKYEFYAKTNNLNNPTTADTSKVGAGIRLTGLDTEFTAISTNNEWVLYTFYVKTVETSTAKVELSLGNLDALTSGEFYIANPTLTKLTDFTDTELEAISESETIKKVVQTASTTDTEDETTDTTTDTADEDTDKYAWIRYLSIILFPVIILGVILVFALKSIYKKLDLDRPNMKNKKSSYDRSHTLSVQKGSKEASSIKAKQIADINKKIESLKQERLKQENSYKQDLSAVRTATKKANKKEIKLANKKANATKKLISLLNKSVDKQNKKINKLNSEEYLKRLTKKCDRLAKKQEKKQTSAPKTESKEKQTTKTNNTESKSTKE